MPILSSELGCQKYVQVLAPTCFYLLNQPGSDMAHWHPSLHSAMTCGSDLLAFGPDILQFPILEYGG